jgi:capsular exopolysaccharide synthesis family protein
MSGEGKSFISINLAMALAISGKKVLLMEMDLRKPKISSGLKLNPESGFSNYVIGQAGKEDIICPSGVNDNFYIIPAGSVPPNPAELILHERTEQLFRYVVTKFDYILIDTPPHLVADAQLISRYSDVTLFAIRLGTTFKDQLRIPNEMARGNKMLPISLVINDIKTNRGKGYYGYGKGGDGYGYGNYIEGNEKKRKRKKVVTS